MQDLQIIQNITHDLIEKMGFTLNDLPEAKEKEGRITVDLSVDRPKTLLGEKGAHLKDIQHILRLLVAKRIDQGFMLDLDINGYKKKKEELLRELAQNIGRRVRREKTEVILEPMNAYERRIVHLALAEYSDLITRSEGRDPGRYIVVAPYSDNGA